MIHVDLFRPVLIANEAQELPAARPVAVIHDEHAFLNTVATESNRQARPLNPLEKVMREMAQHGVKDVESLALCDGNMTFLRARVLQFVLMKDVSDIRLIYASIESSNGHF